MNQSTEFEKPFFDKHWKEIKEFDLLKIFHFLGVNEQGRGRKKYYMYKWVKNKHMIARDGTAYTWYALHLNNDKGDGFYLSSQWRQEWAPENRVLSQVEIVS